MAVQNLMEVFGEETTSRLTGVSKRQLQRWDREGFFSPGFGYENCRDPVSPLYSFRDLVSLRVLRALRKEHRVPMTRLRTTKAKLLKLGDKLWAETKLYVHNRRVGFHNPKTDAIEEVVLGQGLLEIDLRVVSGERREAITISVLARQNNPGDPVIGGGRRRMGKFAMKFQNESLPAPIARPCQYTPARA